MDKDGRWREREEGSERELGLVCKMKTGSFFSFFKRADSCGLVSSGSKEFSMGNTT